MTITLIHGKYVICKMTGSSSAEVLYDGAILQRDGQIIEVGAYADMRHRYPEAELLGSAQHVVMPGLVNDHFHVGMTPFQLGSPDLPLELWGLARMGAKEVDPYLDHLYGAIQMIESGTTTVQLIYNTGRGRAPADLAASDSVIRAYQEAGMRVSYSVSISDQNSLVAGAGGGEAEFAAQLPPDLAKRFQRLMGSGYRTPEDNTARMADICKKYAGGRHERVRVVLAPSNVHRCSDKLLVKLKRLAKEYQTGIHIHLQETAYQKLYGLRAWGVTPLRHLHDMGFLGPEVTCGHSLWLTDEDVDLLVETGTSVCHNASSNLRLQGGIAPVLRLQERGVRVALGTDEAGINDDKDMLQEMRLVLRLHRVPGMDVTPLTSHQVFQMATVNGARASLFGDRIGTLEVGKRADAVLLRLDNIEEPYLDPDVSILDAVVHRGRAIDVDTVIVDGEVVLRDRKFTRIDKDAVYRDLKKSLDRPRRPDEEQRRALSKELEPYLRRFYAGSFVQPRQPHYFYNDRG